MTGGIVNINLAFVTKKMYCLDRKFFFDKMTWNVTKNLWKYIDPWSLKHYWKGLVNPYIIKSQF